MRSLYHEIIESRLDMTNWLIHFSRDFDNDHSAFQNLKSIINDGFIRASLAPRNNRPTIYGKKKAVCFSEQPVWAFMLYKNKINDSKRIGGYGLFVSKHDVYASGGLPVIYGLGSAVVDDRDYQRKLDEKSLPSEEQFRYVAFNPNNDKFPIDWSHEREWRWPGDAISTLPDCYPLFDGAIVSDRGCPKYDVHFFVEHDSDVVHLRIYISNDIVDKTDIFSQKWARKARTRSRIISLETVGRNIGHNLSYCKIDSIIKENLWSDPIGN